MESSWVGGTLLEELLLDELEEELLELEELLDEDELEEELELLLLDELLLEEELDDELELLTGDKELLKKDGTAGDSMRDAAEQESLSGGAAGEEEQEGTAFMAGRK